MKPPPKMHNEHALIAKNINATLSLFIERFFLSDLDSSSNSFTSFSYIRRSYYFNFDMKINS